MGQNKDDHGQPLEYDPEFRGPNKNRSCTDIICLAIFIVFIGCWAGVAIYAYTSGDPNTLLVPKDSYGGRCGLDEHLLDKPYLFFFDLTKCLSPKVPFSGCPTPQVCINKCPDSAFVWSTELNQTTEGLICDYDTKPSSVAEGNEAVKNTKCAKWYLPSQSLLGRCLYNVADRKKLQILNFDGDEIRRIKLKLHSFVQWLQITVHNTVAVFSNEDQTHKFFQNIVDDLITSWWKILIGLLIGVIVCLIYIVIMRWIAAVMIWLSLIAVTGLLAGAEYFTIKKYLEYKDLKQDDEERNLLEKKNTWLALTIVVSILLLFVVLMIIFLRKRIVLAIALVKEGSKAVSSSTSVLVFPIVHWILQLAVIFFALSIALFLATTGEQIYKISVGNNQLLKPDVCDFQIENGTQCNPITINKECKDFMITNDVSCKFQYMKNPKYYEYLQAFNAFGFLWGVFFVTAMGQMILASVFATWYWTWDKGHNLPFFAVTAATLQTLRYHIGTLAFGSLIITICRMIRIALEYVDQNLKKYDNPFTRAILCCMKCFFWCLEKFLKFINRNAYIMCAIHGRNFCMSAKDAFSLLMRNMIRVFVLDYVTDFLFFLGKLMITFGVGAICYVLFATDLTSIDNSGINYTMAPVGTIMICTYLIATIFFNVYSMAVDTLFLCFLEDCERNDGSNEKPYFMSRNLMSIFGKKNKVQ